MKILKNIALLAFLISLFIAVDLGINYFGSLSPELQDGIAYNSFLQSSFGLLEGSLKTKTDFFNVFKASTWITFAILAGNISLYFIPSKKHN